MDRFLENKSREKEQEEGEDKNENIVHHVTCLMDNGNVVRVVLLVWARLFVGKLGCCEPFNKT